MERISNHNNDLYLLISRFKGTKGVEGTMSIMGNRLNDIEEALFEVRDEFYLNDAVGAQLDLIGKLFNVSRAGQTDDEYRISIREKAVSSLSGTPEEIKGALQSLYGGTFAKYMPQAPTIPAAYLIYTDATVDYEDLNRISPAGVTPYLGFPLEDALGNFIEDGAGDTIYHTVPGGI